MLRPVLYTAQKGKDVFTDASRFRTIDSTKNQFKVWDSDRITFNLNSANSYAYTKTVTHNFGYRPQVIAWAYHTEAKEDFSAIELKQEFVLLPYISAQGTDAEHAPLIASVERSNTQVKFKFYQELIMGMGNNYTVTGLKLMYIIFVDPE